MLVCNTFPFSERPSTEPGDVGARASRQLLMDALVSDPHRLNTKW